MVCVTKVLQFTEMDKSMLRLIRQLLLSILLSNEETVIAQVFASISKSDALFMLRESLQLFLHRFILKETENNNSDLNRDQLVTLPKKVEVAENAMRAANSQYDFNWPNSRLSVSFSSTPSTKTSIFRIKQNQIFLFLVRFRKMKNDRRTEETKINGVRKFSPFHIEDNFYRDFAF